MQNDLIILPSAQPALEILGKLRIEVRDAPSFKALEVAAATAEAIQKRFKPVQEVSDLAGEVWTEAEIKLRDEIDKLEKPRRGIVRPGGGKRKKKISPGNESAPSEIPFSHGGPTLNELGITKRRASRAKQLKAIPLKQRNKYIKELKDDGSGVTPNAILKKDKEAKRLAKRAEYAAKTSSGGTEKDLFLLAESDQKFSVIYADVPWEFKVYSGKGKDRSAERHYDTMSIKALGELPIHDLAADDCALLLWSVWPELPGALELIKKWGFEYKTCGFIWVKQNKSGEGFFTGMGYWTRANTEPCLLATKGSPTRLAMDVPQLIVSPVGEHSVKPDETRMRIMRLLPGPYIELFARKPQEGWTTWGNEVRPDEEEGVIE